MTTDEKFMWRCLQLSQRGKGHVSPNPMVGAVIVRDGKIIGEGYHRQYGGPHAEVHAFDSVADKSLIAGADLYVSLEPCSHFGKTPPCAHRVVREQVRRVVVAMIDPNPQVAGRGIALLREAGVEVVVGVLENEARAINKEFMVYQTSSRPYVYLKWAQTQDNFIDKKRLPGHPVEPTTISTDYHKVLVHKMRAEVMGIMVGTNTAINDNPHLTTRLWHGNNPLRVVIDRQGRIPPGSNLTDGRADTIIYTERLGEETRIGRTTYVPIAFDGNLLPDLLADLRRRKICSLMVEGGRQLLQSFIDQGLWDEAQVEIADKRFLEGVEAPFIRGQIAACEQEGGSRIIRWNNKISAI